MLELELKWIVFELHECSGGKEQKITWAIESQSLI